MSLFKKISLSLLIILSLFFFTQTVLAQEGGRWGVGFFSDRTEFVQAPTAAGIIVNVVMWMMSIVALLALGFIVYGAIMYVTSRGDEKQVETAKRILLYAIIGLVIAILAVVIIQLVATVVERGGMEVECCKVTLPTQVSPVECAQEPCSSVRNRIVIEDAVFSPYSCSEGTTCGRVGNDCGCVSP